MAYKILLPFDGSKCSVKAVDHVVGLMAAGQDITCTVLFVTPFPRDLAMFLGISEDEYNKNIEELTEAIKNKVKKIFEIKGLYVQTLFLEGNLVKVICEVAGKEAYDEIVMGSKGYTGIKKAIFGNHSRKIAQKAACSVNIIR